MMDMAKSVVGVKRISPCNKGANWFHAILPTWVLSRLFLKPLQPPRKRETSSQ